MTERKFYATVVAVPEGKVVELTPPPGVKCTPWGWEPAQVPIDTSDPKRGYRAGVLVVWGTHE